MIKGSVMLGKAERGTIVLTPLAGILKATVSRPGLVLALRMASRSEPAPASLVLMTVYVAAPAQSAAAIDTGSKKRVFILLETLRYCFVEGAYPGNAASFSRFFSY